MPPEPTKALPRYRFEFCNTIPPKSRHLAVMRGRPFRATNGPDEEPAALAVTNLSLRDLKISWKRTRSYADLSTSDLACHSGVAPFADRPTYRFLGPPCFTHSITLSI
jgi:hypothetical protein